MTAENRRTPTKAYGYCFTYNRRTYFKIMIMISQHLSNMIIFQDK